VIQSGLGLYIHIPWCEKKCPYCDFNAHALPVAHQLDPVLETRYLNQLLLDLDQDIETFGIAAELTSVFFGGGTPSLLSSRGLGFLLAEINKRLPITTTTECTLEANPGSSDHAKFVGYRAAGINRLSIGVQSFSNTALQRLGRTHTRSDARNAIDAARRAGFSNINLDLMHGLPGQTPDSAIADLDFAAQFAPEHLSWYQLTIEPNTVFYSTKPELPVESFLQAITDEGLDWLQSQGFARYEISAFARSDALQSQHNLTYWRFGDYLGIGAGGHGKISRENTLLEIQRTQKTRVPKDYLNNPNRRVTEVPIQERPIEFLMNACRLVEGFALTDFEQATGLASKVLEAFIAKGTQQGLVSASSGRVTPTAAGLEFLDSLLLLA
jgi:putative oxygen-independent coproporphyrinogen III oxidase